jgi:hypothetical protein
MAAEGAERQTLTELEALIGAAGPDRSDAINALTGTLQALDGDPGVVQDEELPETPVVHRADRLVLDDSLMVKQPRGGIRPGLSWGWSSPSSAGPTRPTAQRPELPQRLGSCARRVACAGDRLPLLRRGAAPG